MARLSAHHLVMSTALIVVWLFTVSCCQDYQILCYYTLYIQQISKSPLVHDQALKYTLLLAWLLRTLKDHPQRKKCLLSFPFLAIHEWISSLLLDENNYSVVLWPACKALLECTASCDPSVMSSVITLCTQFMSQHIIDGHAFNIITDIANTSLNAVLKTIKLPLHEALQLEVSQLYHAIQQIIRKACKKKFTSLLSSPSLISLYVNATPVVPE